MMVQYQLKMGLRPQKYKIKNPGRFAELQPHFQPAKKKKKKIKKKQTGPHRSCCEYDINLKWDKGDKNIK